jgi:hypothetical protein
LLLKMPSTKSNMGKNARNILNAIAWLSVMQSGNMRVNPRYKLFNMRSIASAGLYG